MVDSSGQRSRFANSAPFLPGVQCEISTSTSASDDARLPSGRRRGTSAKRAGTAIGSGHLPWGTPRGRSTPSRPPTEAAETGALPTRRPSPPGLRSCHALMTASLTRVAAKGNQGARQLREAVLSGSPLLSTGASERVRILVVPGLGGGGVALRSASWCWTGLERPHRSATAE